jgi:hypothetical protein
MRRPLLALLAVLLAAGCDQALPDPSVRAVTPAQYEQGTAVRLGVEFDAVLPFDIDYGADTASTDFLVRVQVGDRLIPTEPYPGGNSVWATPPPTLAPGDYEVGVVLSDGRRGTLPSALTVLPGTFPERFTIAPIPDQVRNRPFELFLTAEGGQAALFNGVVRIEVNRGNISPTESGPFTDGTRVQTVTIPNPANDVVITVTDAAGNVGASNPFRVTN